MTPYRFSLGIFLAIALPGLPLILLLFRQQPNLFYWKMAALLLLLGGAAALAGHQFLRARDRKLMAQLAQALRRIEGPEVETSPEAPLELPVPEPLRTQLRQLLRRLQESYQANKQFTQNASHELQTPLAIIKGNVELLIQSDHLTEEESEALGIIIQNTNRLAKLNSALILLAKIENRHFPDTDLIDIRQITEEVLHHFGDLIRIQDIDLRRSYSQQVQVHMSETLAEILIANLIQNAIRHNAEKDCFIHIQLDQRGLRISNPGPEPEFPLQTVFKRFQRRSGSEESLGLGLAIVQRICESYSFQPQYRYAEGLHTFTILFGNP